MPIDTSTSDPIAAFVAELQPRRLRTMAEFAEQEIILPNGPRAGMPFRCSYMPWTRLVFEAMDNPRWRRIFARGSVQSGKTLIFTAIPALYHLCEVGEPIIFAAPTADMAYDIWRERLVEVIKRTRYRDIFPKRGTGSRGGKAKSLQLANGAAVRFMGSGGGDDQRSSYTARVVILTEIDKMDTAGATSRETDPVSQIEARTTAYGDRARIYGECTTSYETGRIYQETDVHGSGTRIHLQCPHCQSYIYPDRDHLLGWQDADNVLAARREAAYVCQSCGVPWSRADLAAARARPILLHKTQTAGDDGPVGPEPETDTLGIVWNAVLSAFVSPADIAEKEFRARLDATDAGERELCQFVWAVPYREENRAAVLSYGHLAQHTGEFAFDPLRATPDRRDLTPEPMPTGIEFTIGAVDVQKRVLYYTLDGYDLDLTRWTLAWGVTEIVPEGAGWDPTERHVRVALDTVRDILETYDPETIWVDVGYRHEGALEHVVRTWTHEQGDGVHPVLGRSEGTYARLTGTRMELPDGTPDLVQARLQPDGVVLWMMDVDRIKDELYYRLFRVEGSPGYHLFAREAANPKRTDRSRGPASVGYIFSHIMGVRRDITLVGGREKRLWIEGRRHDLWDCMTYSLGGALVTRADILEQRRAAQPDTTPEGKPTERTIRTTY